MMQGAVNEQTVKLDGFRGKDLAVPAAARESTARGWTMAPKKGMIVEKTEAKGMKVTVLGMNGPYPASSGACSGYLVTSGEARIQLDLGSGTLAALTALTPPEALTALVFSHWHFDHCSDAMPLIYRLADQVCGRVLPVYGPEDAASPVRAALGLCPAVRLCDLAPGDSVVLDGVRLTAFEARHPVPALMLRLEGGGKTLCYTGDTNTVPGLEDFARNADLLLADGLFPTALWAEGKPHLAAAMTAALARDAGAKRLVVTHLNPGIDPEGLLREARAIRPDAVLAERGAVYTL